MTSEDYKATPEQWAFLRDCAANGPSPLRDQSAAQNSCILELRARVEALEATQEPTACPHIVSSDEGTSYCRLAEQTQDKLDRLIELDRAEPAPAGSLVERVATFITPTSQPLNREWARDGICQVAGWLRERGHASAASSLEQEAGQ